MRRNQFESFNVADAVLRLRGCPFGTTKDDVLKFFEGLDLVEGGVVIPNDEMGRCGEATTNNKMKMIKLLERRRKKNGLWTKGVFDVIVTGAAYFTSIGIFHAFILSILID